MPTIGFIGLGNMGAPMAANLVKAGNTLTGFDVVAAVREAGAHFIMAETISEHGGELNQAICGHMTLGELAC